MGTELKITKFIRTSIIQNVRLESERTGWEEVTETGSRLEQTSKDSCIESGTVMVIEVEIVKTERLKSVYHLNFKGGDFSQDRYSEKNRSLYLFFLSKFYVSEMEWRRTVLLVVVNSIIDTTVRPWYSQVITTYHRNTIGPTWTWDLFFIWKQ